jgi:hypothetical protein
MIDRDWIAKLFEAIDARQIDGFLSFLDADCSFRFGNLPAVTGVENIRVFLGGFFDSIAALKHEMSAYWIVPDGAICHGMVSYTRLDQSVLTVPFAIILLTSDGKIHEYLIFADTSELYHEG